MEDHAIATLRSHTQQKQAPAPAGKSLQLDSNSVKKSLGNIPAEAALHYLSDLFKGNGWTVAHSDAGYSPALLLSDPKHPDAILLIVKFLKLEHALTYQEARDELIDFENNLSPKYQCSQFAIIALNGISTQAESLERFNLLLQDWSYIDELIKNYSTTKIQEPRTQLFAHNKQTYKKVQRMMKHCTSIAVVQATGTGKSFLIAKLLQDFTGEKRLVMAPSMYVIDQVKEHIRWDAGNIEYMTYARSMNLSQSDIAALNPRMIVLDEFHRCGAEEWGRGVQNIINAYPQAFKLGTSATPVRYMDNARDMSVELFNNNVAENLSLAQAIVRNILPMPKYVCALYTLTEERDILRDKISSSRSTEVLKKRMQLDLDTATIDWERSHGIPSILQKYLQPHMKKFIIFCKDEEHLLEMEPIVSGWFSAATNTTEINTYRIYVGEPKSLDNLKAFKAADTKAAIHLLFSINMLNEGLHVNEVSGVVLLRPTESPNIFYQQIGRCLKVGLNYSPVIFDLVNNFKGIRTKDFMYDLEFAHSQYATDRINENLEDRCPAFTVMDEVREITEVFGEIKFRLDDWEGMFQRLVEYKELFGHCIISSIDGQYTSLYSWLRAQRKKIERNLMEPEHKNRLLALGVDMTLHKFDGWKDGVWENRFNELNTFRLKYGHCNVTTDRDDENASLRKFVDSQRRSHVLDVLSEYRRHKLLSIGFEFESSFLEGRWQVQFDALVAYKNEHGHFVMYKLKYTPLARWITSQRISFTKGTLDEGRKQKLNSIGFTWSEDPEEIFEKKFEDLITWYQQKKHFTFPAKSKLGYVANYIRKKYQMNVLPVEKIELLRSMSFDFELADSRDEIRERRVQQVELFFKHHKHAHITERNETHKGLNNWLKMQRKLFKQGVLTDNVVKRMEAAGVDWHHKKNTSDKNWNYNYEQLIELKRKTGGFSVPTNEMKALSHWCAGQRISYQRRKLPAERIERLEAIGFKWQVIDGIWEERFASLSRYHNLHGHSTVNSKRGETRSLGLWCISQRNAYKKGNLPQEKIKRLESLGFTWDVNEDLWQINYNRLKTYIGLFGWDGLCSKNPKLFNWVSTHRADYKNKKLPAGKIMLLNMTGINWNPFDEYWNKMFQEFIKYSQLHGHTRVAHADKSYKDLWTWCVSQRSRYRRKTLPEEQIKLLAYAGFEWKIKGGTVKTK